MTATQTNPNIVTALVEWGRMKKRGEDALLILRTDHPHIAGDWFYAIKTADKRKWTAGERALTQDEITDLWYAADCPPC